MRNDAKRAAAVAMRNRTVRCAGAVRQIAIGLGVAFAMSNAVAAGHAASDGIVRFTGALVDLYDVTLDAPAGVVVEGRAVANGGRRQHCDSMPMAGVCRAPRWRWSGPTVRRSRPMSLRACVQRGAMRTAIEACRWYRAARIASVRMAA